MTKILITGTSGFIASELIPKLKEKNYDIYGLSRYVTGRLGAVSGIPTYYADFRDGFLIRKIIRELQPEVVMHIGAMTRVSDSYEQPQQYMETNLIGTINLAEACLRESHNFKHFLFAGTSEMYGNNGIVVQRENASRKPASPYAVSKVACENYLNYMKEAYNFPVTTLIPFNTYGRKNDFHFFIERAITQMLTKKKVELIDPDPVRDWMYVDDHVKAYIACVENEKSIGESFNFCTGTAFSIKDTSNFIADLTDFTGEIIWNSAPKRPTESKIILGSSSKARNIIGWTPRYQLEEGLKLAIENIKRVLKIE
jgi:nucleoside-diphosphate-sugar epimerase